MFELILIECISYPSRRPARHVAADAPTAAVAAASTAARIIRHRTPDCPAPHGARRCERRALRVEGAGSIERHARRGSSTSSSHRRRPRPRPTAVLPRLLAGAHCAVFSVKMSKPPSSQDPYGWRGGGGQRASRSQDSTNNLSRRRRELPPPNITTAALFFHARHHSNPTRRIFAVDGRSAWQLKRWSQQTRVRAGNDLLEGAVAHGNAPGTGRVGRFPVPGALTQSPR